MSYPLFGTIVLGAYPASTLSSSRPDIYWKWRVQWYHKSGGLKRDWFIGQDKCPITALKFERNLKICGAGTIKLAYLDFPIDADDYIKVYFNESLKYRAIVDNSIDVKGNENIKLIPYSTRYKELFVNASYSTQTLPYIFEDIVTDMQTDTGVVWMDSQVDADFLADTTTYTKDYLYEYGADAFDDLIKKVANLEWGVTPENFFTIYQQSTEVTKLLLQGDTPDFAEVSVEYDFESFGDTRQQVYYKNADAGESVRAGEVGYGGGYATLALESYLRKKEGKKEYPIPFATDAEALAFAYAELTNKRLPRTISVKDINLDNYEPTIKQKITVEDAINKILYTAIDCDTTTGWYNATADTSDFVEKDWENNSGGSLYFAGSASPTEIIYDFGRPLKPFHCERFGFMIKSTYAGSFLECSFGLNKLGAASYSIASRGKASQGYDVGATTDLWDTCYQVDITNAGVWSFISFDVSTDALFTTNGVRYFGLRFKSTPPASTTVHIDRIQFYMYTRMQYTSNIVQENYTIDSKGYTCDIKLDSYDLQANKVLFDIQRQVDTIEAAQENTA